jgi:hypothetical protein
MLDGGMGGQGFCDDGRAGKAIAASIGAELQQRRPGQGIDQLPAAFEHFNEVHPHSSLKMKSPRQFRQWQANQCQNQLAPSASNCV